MTTSRQDFPIWRLGRSQTLRIKIASCGIHEKDENLKNEIKSLIDKESSDDK